MTTKSKHFLITGFMPKSDHVMCGYARSNQELAQRIAELFEQHPSVIYVEIARSRSNRDNLQKIYDDAGRPAA